MLLSVLVALAAVLCLSLVLARVFSRFGQPPVVAEMAAGILLGPSLLGAHLSGMLLPPEAAPGLGIIAQFGVILYMFLVGLELDGRELRRSARVTLNVSYASILVPFALGILLALLLYSRPGLAGPEVGFAPFALFFGAAMSVTAFPVLARILSDRRMTGTEVGRVALTAAAANDVAAWCLLAVAVGVAQSKLGQGLGVAAAAAGYAVLMLALVRPLIVSLVPVAEGSKLSRNAVALVFLGLLVSSAATEAIGVHAVFGAFFFGALIPHDSAIARAFLRQLGPLVTVMLLPAFFAMTGMRTRIDAISGFEQWALCLLVIAVATAGKFGGTFFAARASGIGGRDSATLGVLMNTRGLMELIVLHLGLDMGVITPELFAMMVVMALVTTAMTGPALGWLGVGTPPSNEGTTSEKPKSAARRAGTGSGAGAGGDEMVGGGVSKRSGAASAVAHAGDAASTAVHVGGAASTAVHVGGAAGTTSAASASAAARGMGAGRVVATAADGDAAGRVHP